jgi:hypothetical protein
MGTSSLRELHIAVGQVLNYRMVLAESDPERILYLAVPTYAYAILFETPKTATKSLHKAGRANAECTAA